MLLGSWFWGWPFAEGLGCGYGAGVEVGCMGEGGALGRVMPGEGRGCWVTAGDCCVERAGVCGDARGEARREFG